MDVIADMASVTYKRLEAAMEDAQEAVKNEAWELVAALIEILQQENAIPKEKRLEYARGIRDFSHEMYLEKLARFRGEKQYSHCRELAEYWLIGKSLAESLERTRQPTGTREERTAELREMFNSFYAKVEKIVKEETGPVAADPETADYVLEFTDEMTEAELAEVEKMKTLWYIEQDPEKKIIEIRPGSDNRISIHGAQEARHFIEVLQEVIQETF